jgi:cold shock CspA family protein
VTGIIVREFLPKGFCFVEGEDGQEYFLHANQLPDGEWSREKIKKGARVQFEPQPNPPKGFKATNAWIVTEAHQ